MIPNRQLRAAREATPSPYVAGACMSRAELAEAINRWVEANSSAHGALDEHYVGRLERGKVTWPGQHYRAGFRAVLGATTDADLGFFPSNRRPVTPLAAVLDDSEVITPDEADRIAYVASRPRRVDRAALDSLAVVLAEQRRLEDAIGAGSLVAPIRGWMTVLEALVVEAHGALRPAVVDLAAQWSQFTGWLYAATNELALSDGLLSRTFEWATEADNVTLQANALSYKGHLAWMREQTGPLIGLSQAAQRNPDVHVTQRAFDAMQEARGHAMAGDARMADQRLEAALFLSVERFDEAPPWSYYYSAPFWTLQQGLIYSYLEHRANAAAELLTSGLAELPAEHRDAEWTGDYRRALGRLTA